MPVLAFGLGTLTLSGVSDMIGMRWSPDKSHIYFTLWNERGMVESITVYKAAEWKTMLEA